MLCVSLRLKIFKKGKLWFIVGIVDAYQKQTKVSCFVNSCKNQSMMLLIIHVRTKELSKEHDPQHMFNACFQRKVHMGPTTIQKVGLIPDETDEGLFVLCEDKFLCMVIGDHAK